MSDAHSRDRLPNMRRHNPICSSCVADAELRAWVEEHGAESTCAYCEDERACCDLETVAREIDEAIRKYYTLAPEEGHVESWTDNIVYYAEGETAEEIIRGIIDCSEAVRDIVSILSEDETREVRDGGDELYGDSPLQHVSAYAGGFLETWDSFEYRLKHEIRFCDEEGRRMLDTLFGDLPDYGGGRAILTLAPDDPALKLYRARIIEEESRSEDFIRDPARHIGPPAPDRARAGRMNPAGISVFYGAFSPEVALAEIRPPVGSLVGIGEFSLLKPLRLLDMSFLPFAYHEESMFSSKYDEARSKLRFLNVFHGRISRPVLPNDEVLAYLPTQAVAAYVANVMHLDGIVYSSTQVGAEDESTGEQLPRTLCNVVLFGAAAIVERTPAPSAPAASLADHDPFAVVASTGMGVEEFVDLGRTAQASDQPAAPGSGATSQSTEAVAAGGSVIRQPDGLGENGAPAGLRIKRDPKLVRIRAVKVETSPMFAHLYEDGSVIVDDYTWDWDD